MKNTLTPKQMRVLSVVKDLRAKLGKAPTLDELRKALGYSGVSSVQRHLYALKRKGVLSNEPYQARSLEITSPEKTINIPLVGNAACGTPFLAVENIEAYIPYPASNTRYQPDDLFFLRAVGDSMNATNIKGKTIDNGDFVLVRKTNTSDSGQRVVALVGNEATIKKLRIETDKVVLEPESTNPANKRFYILDKLLIQGVVVDVLKKGVKND